MGLLGSGLLMLEHELYSAFLILKSHLRARSSGRSKDITIEDEYVAISYEDIDNRITDSKRFVVEDEARLKKVRVLNLLPSPIQKVKQETKEEKMVLVAMSAINECREELIGG